MAPDSEVVVSDEKARIQSPPLMTRAKDLFVHHQAPFRSYGYRSAERVGTKVS